MKGVSIGLRERKKSQTRRALRAATLRLVAEHGLEAVTIEQISAAADVSARTFFNYFATKEDALTSADPGDAERVRERLAGLPADLSPVEAVRLVMAGELARLEGDDAEWRLRMAIVDRHPALLARILADYAATERLLAQAVAARTGSDLDDDLYPTLVAEVCLAAARAATRLWMTDQGRGLVELFDEAVATLAAGLPTPH
jgi:AcrR family transcriptional regulator